MANIKGLTGLANLEILVFLIRVCRFYQILMS